MYVINDQWSILQNTTNMLRTYYIHTTDYVQNEWSITVTKKEREDDEDENDEEEFIYNAYFQLHKKQN